MSPSAADTLLTGADPNTPAKKRVMNAAAAVSLVAVPIEKRPRQNIAGKRLHRRPQTSETGAHKRGPNSKPMLRNVKSNFKVARV